MTDAQHADFNFEPIPGLPALLPDGETIVWQGSPDPLTFAVEVMRLRFVACLVAALVLWRASAGLHDAIGWQAVLVVAGGTLIGGLIALALLAVSGWLMARGTIYTITTARLVIRHGVAMPMAINIPFSKVASAAVAEGLGGNVSVALAMLPPARSSLIALWPHARPFFLRRPEPSLRAVPQAVAARLTEALARAAGQVADTRAAATGHGAASPEAATALAAAEAA